MKAPQFWYHPAPNFAAKALMPLGQLWRGVSYLKRKTSRPYRASVPVICVGNLTVGGSGKTPVVHSIVRLLQDTGHKPGILLRGYKGQYTEDAVHVDPTQHRANYVGDEALLHAQYAPTVVAKDRRCGAQLLSQLGRSVIVMDDGLQNPTLHQDIKLAVVDAARGLGNGMLIPAGPLREPLDKGLQRIDGLIVLTPENATNTAQIDLPQSVLRLDGTVKLRTPEGIAPNQPLYAFCGLGHPEKFFDSLRSNGLTLVGTKAFHDHYAYNNADILALLRQAGEAVLATTAKDAVKISPELRKSMAIFDVSIDWKNLETLAKLIKQ